MRRTITLTTDFGTRDGYVGALKGVIRSIAPDARLLDISHDIGHGRIRQASFLLDNILEFFPAGTIHLVVVDPTVGSQRHALIVEYRDCLLVGPDNGVFETAFRDSGAWSCYGITEDRFMLPRVSNSFHGRDIFAPAAAHLAQGVSPAEFGPSLEEPVRQSGPRKKVFGDGRIVGSVIHSDRFGNLITNITVAELDTLASGRDSLRISLCGKIIQGISSHYAQAQPGKLLALVGGTGRLEVAVNLDSAAAVLGTPSLDAEITVSESGG